MRKRKLFSPGVFFPRSGRFTVSWRRLNRMLALSQSFFVLRFGGLCSRDSMFFRSFLAFAPLCGALSAFFLFFFLLRRFFDSGQFPQDLFALFRCFGTSGQL